MVLNTLRKISAQAQCAHSSLIHHNIGLKQSAAFKFENNLGLIKLAINVGDERWLGAHLPWPTSSKHQLLQRYLGI